MNFKEELQKKTAEIEALLQTYLPEETGFQKTARDLPDVRRRGKGRGALYGGYGNDTYLFAGT